MQLKTNSGRQPTRMRLYSRRKSKGERFIFEPVCEKPNNLGSNQARHKPAFTVTGDG